MDRGLFRRLLLAWRLFLCRSWFALWARWCGRWCGVESGFDPDRASAPAAADPDEGVAQHGRGVLALLLALIDLLGVLIVVGLLLRFLLLSRLLRLLLDRLLLPWLLTGWLRRLLGWCVVVGWHLAVRGGAGLSLLWVLGIAALLPGGGLCCGIVDRNPVARVESGVAGVDAAGITRLLSAHRRWLELLSTAWRPVVATAVAAAVRRALGRCRG